MDKGLLKWLNNSNRDIATGKSLYKRLGTDLALLDQIDKCGNTAQGNKFVFDALRSIYYLLKNNSAPTTPQMVETNVVPIIKEKIEESAKSELLISCEKEAKKCWQLLMNKKAQLFYNTTVDETDDENNPRLVNERKTLVLELMDLQVMCDEAYNIVDYVAEHGHLPIKKDVGDILKDVPKNPVLMERYRLNIQKAISKLLLQPKTPKRIQMIEDKEKLLKIITDCVDRFIAEWKE